MVAVSESRKDWKRRRRPPAARRAESSARGCWSGRAASAAATAGGSVQAVMAVKNGVNAQCISMPNRPGEGARCRLWTGEQALAQLPGRAGPPVCRRCGRVRPQRFLSLTLNGKRSHAESQEGEGSGGARHFRCSLRPRRLDLYPRELNALIVQIYFFRMLSSAGAGHPRHVGTGGFERKPPCPVTKRTRRAVLRVRPST
jgi:hypothetical protein